MHFLGALSVSLLCLVGAAAGPLRTAPAADLQRRQGSPATGVLTDFQVYPPVLTPAGTDNQYGCVHTQTLMQHDFANSYGAPFVGNYTPPPCSFNRVTINFTVTSQGRQYDRLALMYLGDTEVWRTSTAEPTTQGIVWTYVKEMQHFNALWRSPQTLIFDLGNLVNSEYTGIYHTTLTATFFTAPDSAATADAVLPISKGLAAQGMGSAFQVPGDNASSAHTLPHTVTRAVVGLSACGQQDEEFWYTNVLDGDTQAFEASAGALLGGGPWREVQLLIDGQLAGVAWPFPIIFTGGIVPGFWRPMVGIDAFDLREREIDVSPWLPVLLDGRPHTFEIRVASIAGGGAGDSDVTVAETPTSYWLVSGNIFLFTDSSSSSSAAASGKPPTVRDSGPRLQVASHVQPGPNGTNQSLTYTVSASRSLSISNTFNGRTTSWTQDLSFSNYNQLTAGGFTQVTRQTTGGSDRAAPAGYFAAYSFPLVVNSSLGLDSSGAVSSINGSLTRGLNFGVAGPAVFPDGVQPFAAAQPGWAFSQAGAGPARLGAAPQLPVLAGSVLNTSQSAVAEYFATAAGTSNQSFSFGTTNQTMTFAGLALDDGATTELYSRDVSAVNTTIVHDHQVLLGQEFDGPTAAAHPLGKWGAPSEGSRGPKGLLGKGGWK